VAFDRLRQPPANAAARCAPAAAALTPVSAAAGW